MIKKQIYTLIFTLISCSAYASLSKEMREEGARPYLQSQVNQIVVDTACKVYNNINQNWSYIPAGKHNPKVELQNWHAKYVPHIVYSGGKKCVANIPSLIFEGKNEEFGNSLENLTQSPVIAECTCALTAAKILILKELLGKSFTDYINYFKQEMKKREWATDKFFYEVAEQFISEKQESNVRKGYLNARKGNIVYISNLDYYSHFKPRGNARGSNVIKVSEDKYIGFSPIYKEGPQSLHTIAIQDKKLFCLEDDLENEHEHHKRICDVIHKVEGRFFKDFLSAQTNQPTFYFDVNRINEFLKNKKFVEFRGN